MLPYLCVLLLKESLHCEIAVVCVLHPDMDFIARVCAPISILMGKARDMMMVKAKTLKPPTTVTRKSLH